MGFPSFLAKPVEWAIGARIDADWGSLDAISTPTISSCRSCSSTATEDEVVPISTSDDFAEALPRWVTYFRIPESGPHGEHGTSNRRLYERRLAAFLEQVG